MSDFDFEFVLSKQCGKKSSLLYSNNINLNQHSYKPQDVISSVSCQLKAIHNADSSKSKKRTAKDFEKFKNSTLLCVNNLSVLEEEPPKPTTKFDTQCITDTQLMNIIEDAEILDVHQGITQEFETAFIHTNTEEQDNEYVRSDVDDDEYVRISDTNKCLADNVTDAGNIEAIPQKTDDIEQSGVNKNHDTDNIQQSDGDKDSLDTDTLNVDDKHESLEYISQIVNEPGSKSTKPFKNKAQSQNTIVYNNRYCIESDINSDYDNSEVEQLSQVLQTKVVNFKKKKDRTVSFEHISDNLDGNRSEIEQYSQLDQHIEMKDDDTERPTSPIFINKNVNLKSKSPSPLVFNLDQFEHFETIALSLINCDGDNNAKHLVNSQILHKELHLNVNKNMEFIDANILSPILHEKVDKEHSKTLDVKELHKTGKATSEKTIDQLKPQNVEDIAEIKTMTAHGFSNDEILFSSDEDETYSHKEYQYLPFTCALDPSFLNQSEILDKTLYVGFQTASNRSIQVCADSFARAKSLLSDVGIDQATVTELVNNCETSGKDESVVEKVKVKMNDEEESLNIAKTNNIQSQIGDLKVLPKNQMGFMTASNKNINLSKQGLARCKKVFQDIDLNEDFDDVDKENLEEVDMNGEANNKESNYDPKQPVTEDGINSVNSVLEGIDDEIIQEFENIEMSLEDIKEGKGVTSNAASYNNIPMSNVTLDELDVPFSEDLNKSKSKENINIEELSQIIGNKAKEDATNTNVNSKASSNKHIEISEEAWSESNRLCISKLVEATEKNIPDLIPLPTAGTGFVGFKTANNKDIKISDNALARSISIFKDIDCAEKVPDKLHKVASNGGKLQDSLAVMDTSQPSTSKGFLGFKTANNKNIKISEKAWSKSKNVFNNIDSMELPNKENKHDPSKDDYGLSNPKTEEHFASFKITTIKTHASEERPSNTKIILNNINSSDFVLSAKLKSPQKTINATETNKQFKDLKGAETSDEFVGFKSASNKLIKVSEKAVAETRNFFNDIDSEYTKQNMNEEKGVQIEAEAKFVGFKTGNNKNIQISNEALAKTKDIFKDIGNSKLESKIRKVYHGFEEHQGVRTYDQASSTSYNTIPKNRTSVIDSNQELKALPEAAIKSLSKDIKSQDVSTNTGDKINREEDLNHKEFINNNRDVECKLTSEVFKGFQTANKKPVSISVKALEKSKQMFLDMDLQKSDNVSVNNRFSGFQTASNKQVKISEKALANSRKIFKDIDNIDAETKSTKVKALYPEEILQENQINLEITNDITVNESEDTIGGFKGFQTASKKTVTISKLALEKSKMLFKDLDELNHETFESCGSGITEGEKGFEKKVGNKTLKTLNSKVFQAPSSKKEIVFEDELTKTGKNQRDGVQEEIVAPSNFKMGFQTGNNKAITISEEALAKSKRLFSEIEEECSINNMKRNKKSHGPEDIHATLDTQLLNNFEESLHTEDFIEPPNNCKNPGSPILSCPRAKKRKKFETPYITKSIPKPVVKEKEVTVERNKIFYRKDNKKKKELTLKDLDKMTKIMTKTIDPYLLNFVYDNLLQFEFNHGRNDLSSDKMTIETLKEYFLNSVNAKLVPTGWLDNHIQLILWKLISYEIKFKSVIVCTARNVLDQLKFRYDKELYNAQRPALRKILEKDDVPSKTMVLCVVGIYVDGAVVSSITNTSSNIELLLTDGWYSIRCNIDRMLTQLVCGGKVTVGCKLVTSGAELIGCEQGVAPWEDTSAVRLKIYGNSTRRARWDARLGYLKHGPMLSQLSSIQVVGGKVSKLRLFVTRVYPALYVEKFEDGSTVTRSERLENIHQMKTEAERQAFMEKLYEEVEKEFADQESQDSVGLSDSYKRTCMDSGSQIAKMMKRSKDPAEFRAQLTDSQLRLLETHTSKDRDKLLQDMQTRIKDRLEKEGSCTNRNVVSLLKIRVVGVAEKGDSIDVSKGMMSIWKPNDAIQEVIKEGVWIDVMNVVPTAVRYSEIQISAGRQSVFNASRYKEPEKSKPYTKLLQRQCYTIKNLARNPSMSTDYNEIDTAGLIFLIDPSIKEFDSTKQSFQNVYLADADKNIICVNFWGGLQKFGYQNVLDTGQVTACVNLQKRAGNTRKSIPQFRVTEFSYFTQTPKNDIARKMLDDINKKLVGLDRRKFCHDCVVLKNNYLLTKNNENISPYRFMNTDINMPKNKVFVDSPLLRPNRMDENFNLTGLDFESTFKQDSQLSEEMLKRKIKVNEKIARLKMYGEPPPLSPMHIMNRSKQACSSYKSPLLSSNNNSSFSNKVNENSNLKTVKTRTKSDSSENVTSVENTPSKCGVQCEVSNSPVLLNRTYVKCVNPVKINFDVQENNDSHVDDFAEEFEGSPPLSLD